SSSILNPFSQPSEDENLGDLLVADEESDAESMPLLTPEADPIVLPPQPVPFILPTAAVVVGAAERPEESEQLLQQAISAIHGYQPIRLPLPHLNIQTPTFHPDAPPGKVDRDYYTCKSSNTCPRFSGPSSRP
ncbi:hypothetical protein PENTCL1PPCAC_1998, partial [Pristionchus entomophagus]